MGSGYHDFDFEGVDFFLILGRIDKKSYLYLGLKNKKCVWKNLKGIRAKSLKVVFDLQKVTIEKNLSGPRS